MSIPTTPGKGQIGLGSQVFIGPATSAISGTPTFVLIGEVTSAKPSGSKRQVVTYSPLDRLNVQKRLGSANAGSTALEIARVGSDTGQIALAAAHVDATGQTYRFQIVIPANPDDDETVATTIWTDAAVAEYNAFSGFTTDGVLMMTASLEQVNDWTIQTPA